MNRKDKHFDILGFVDEDEQKWGQSICDLPVLGGLEWISANLSSDLVTVCGIGNTLIRSHIIGKCRRIGTRFATLIHPSVQMSRYVEVGDGVVICAGCVVTTQVQLKNHVYLNSNCTVAHDTLLEQYVNCAPSCNISGDVHLQEGAHLGTGVQVIPGRTVGKYTTVGAGAVVIRDLPSWSVAVGVPAKVIKRKEETPK
jgi:sugar O-acyltransferase (sialic acid O-acetyltransferase NeuD family)